MDKFTKIALASAFAITFAASAYAGAYKPPIHKSEHFSGFYIGIGGGIVGTNADVTTTHQSEDVLPIQMQGAGPIFFAEPATDAYWLDEGPDPDQWVQFSDMDNFNNIITSWIEAGGIVTSGAAQLDTLSIDDFKNIHKADELGKYGFTANVFVGLGQVIDAKYYIGGELFANYFSPRLKHSFNHDLNASFQSSELVDFFAQYEIPPEVMIPGTFIRAIFDTEHDLTCGYMTTTEIKNRYSFGGDLRLGRLVSSKTMLYVLFGLDYSKFKVNSTGKLSIQSLGDDFLAGDSVLDITDQFSKSKIGYIPGVGMETVLNSNHQHDLSLRAEYRHTFYQSFEHTAQKTIATERIDINPLITEGQPFVDEQVDYTHSLTTKVRPSRGVFSLILSYYVK